MKKLWWAALALSCVASVHAAEQRYMAQGTLVPFGLPSAVQTYSFMEVWGSGSADTRYAQPAAYAGDAFYYLIAGSEAASANALGGYAFASAGIGYDASASPDFVSANGNYARYAIGPITIDLVGAGQPPVSLGAADTALDVRRSQSGRIQSLNFWRTALTVDGPVPGSSFSYSAPAAPPVAVDLVELLGPTAYLGDSFDLSAFASLPIRLSAPTSFRPVDLRVNLARFRSTPSFGIAPPAELLLADFSGNASIDVVFDGIFGVAVDVADFADSASFQAASSWVSANIRQINFQQVISYDITSLVPVPELPTAWLMLLGGMPALLLAGRRRR